MRRPERATLNLVTGSEPSWPAMLVVVHAAARNGLDWVQLRDHQATARELLERARELIQVCRPLGVRVAVNDRVDVALAAGADGVQLGSRSLPVQAVRRLAPNLLIGASVHSVAEAMRAGAEGASWVTFGHVFPTQSHPNVPSCGLDLLAEVARAVAVPAIAIGGIGLRQVAPVLETGARGIAVISAIAQAPDPGQATAALRQALDRR